MLFLQINAMLLAKAVIYVVYKFKTSELDVEYIESEIEHPVLWESHCHSQYEMIAVAEGDITVTPEGQSYPLKANQVILLPPLCYHSVVANGKGRYCRITALFTADVIPKVLQSAFANQERSAAVTPSQLEKLRDICQKGDPAFYGPLLSSLMTEIFYDALQTPSEAVKTETDEFLQKALQYIDEHLHEKILLDDLAKATARSKSSFCHLFERKMNISPKQYILQKKLSAAQKLMDEGVPHTIAAMQIGYENYSNFYRLYQKNLEKRSHP